MAAATEALIEQDADGVITDWNADAERLFGWPRAEAIGMASSALIPARNHYRHAAALGALIADQDRLVIKREITVVDRAGREFVARFRASRDARGNQVRILVFLSAVTPQTRVAQAAEAFENSDRYRAILDQIEDGCCVVDVRGHFIFVNDAFCRMFGFEKQEILGAHFKKTMGVERSAQLREIYQQVYTTGVPVKAFKYQVSSKNAATRFVEQSISLERNSHGQPVGFLAITRDCTARHEAEEAAAHAREAAEAANRAKSEFLANMSHEIRTPMNGIIGMTSLALDTELTPYQAECLNSVRVSAESLLTILNDVLDFSKIESRKLEMESVPFSLADVVGDALKPLALRAHEKRLELVCDIAAGTPAGIVGDAVRLKQIVTNLVGNAIKFTDRGQIVVAVREETRTEGCTKLHFSVADTGMGIPPDKHDAIFEAFRQADGSTTRRFGGTGLGLAICSTLVQMMGGRIWVESVPGAGSTFHFTAAFDLADVAAAPLDESRLAHVRTLIVDDTPINRRILAAQVSTWGMDATVVDGGQAALDVLADAAARGRPFGLVLLDANMPDIDGFTVAERIAQRPELAGSTIMMLSSSGLAGDVARCRAVGIAAYLTKPVKASDLHDAVCRTLDRAAQVTATPRATAPQPSPLAPAPRPMRVLVAEDNAVNQRVAGGLLGKRGHIVTVAANGLEALAAIDTQEFDVVLMDVQMPDMGGFEATAVIRARERERGGHLRIVAMTAHAMNGDRERCIAAGMDGYIAKPLDPRLLYSVVEQPPEWPPANTVDTTALLERLGGDEQLMADAIQLFLADCPARLDAIRAAVAEGDAERIRTEAHSLKGAAGNLSATGLFDAAQILERIGSERRLEAAVAGSRLVAVEATRTLDALRRFERRG